MEVMIVLGLTAIIASVALPSGKRMLADRQISAAAGALLSALDYARATAISRAKPVVFCPSSDGATYGAAEDWHTGWITWIDEDENGQFNSNDHLLNSKQLVGDLTIDAPAAVDTGFQFGAYGRPSFSQQTLVAICDERGVVEPARAVLLTVAGRGSVSPAVEAGVKRCKG